jgi:hypothetical protein
MNPMIGGKVDKTSFNKEKLSMLSTISRGRDANFDEKTSYLIIKVAKGDKSRSVG